MSEKPVVIERESDGETVTVWIRPALRVDENGRTVETDGEHDER